MNEEEQFLADAEQVREEQVGPQGSTPQVDPAVQAGIDYAAETAGSAPEPGSGEPGFFGLGGLSKMEIEAQKQSIGRQQDPDSV
jgi:hypothetical protein